MIIDGFTHQLPDTDPERDRGMARIPRLGHRLRRPEPGPFPHGPPDRPSPRAGRRVPASVPRRTSTRFPGAGSLYPGDEYLEKPDPALHPLECRGDGDPSQHGGGRTSADTSPPLRRRPTCTRSGSTTSSSGKDGGQPGDHVYIQGHASPGIYSRAYLEHRLDENDLDRFRQGDRTPGLCPATPTRASCRTSGSTQRCRWAWGPINSIYHARYLKYLAQPGHRRHLRLQGVVLPRRR